MIADVPLPRDDRPSPLRGGDGGGVLASPLNQRHEFARVHLFAQGGEVGGQLRSRLDAAAGAIAAATAAGRAAAFAAGATAAAGAAARRTAVLFFRGFGAVLEGNAGAVSLAKLFEQGRERASVPTQDVNEGPRAVEQQLGF